MFEHTLLPFADGATRRRTRWIIVSSLSVQALALCFLVAAPLLYPSSMPPFHFARLRTVEIVRSKPALPPKPIVVKPLDAHSSAARASAPVMMSAGHATLAPRTPTSLAEPPLLQIGGGIMPSGQLTGVLDAFKGTGAGPVVHVKPAASGGGTGPVRLSSGVTSGMLLAPIRPSYPQIARVTRTEGTVVVTAIIDTAGRIVGIRILSGPAMLRPAAEDAVREARYRPYLLNGLPVEVETTISVSFRIGS